MDLRIKLFLFLFININIYIYACSYIYIYIVFVNGVCAFCLDGMPRTFSMACDVSGAASSTRFTYDRLLNMGRFAALGIHPAVHIYIYIYHIYIYMYAHYLSCIYIYIYLCMYIHMFNL